MSEEIRLGRQTPTQFFTLPYTSTKGPEAIEIYNATGRTAQEWQTNLIYDILAQDNEGRWIHSKYGFSVPRQNGKNEVVVIRELFALIKGERVLHTAHRTSTSHAAFERLVKLLDALGYKEQIRVKKDDAPADGYTAYKQFGLENVKLCIGDGVVNFRTRSSTGGLGESYDVLVIDEAQEYTDDQESALKYVIAASPNAQTIFCGTPPTAVSSGTVFLKYRNKTLAGESENSGWSEWGVSRMTDVHDVDAWYQCNPSLGTINTERNIIDEIGTDDLDFNIQRLGLWIQYSQKSAISEKEWMMCKLADFPQFEQPMCIGIKYGKDGLNVAMAVALKASFGVYVEVLDCRPRREGNEWILNFIRSNEKNIAQIVVDGQGAQEIIAEEMADMRIKLKPVFPTVGEIKTSNAIFEKAVFDKTLRHNSQPSLTEVVSNCDHRGIGSNGGFGYKAIRPDDEISLLDAVVLAHWSALQVKEKKKQRVTY